MRRRYERVGRRVEAMLGADHDPLVAARDPLPQARIHGAQQRNRPQRLHGRLAARLPGLVTTAFEDCFNESAETNENNNLAMYIAPAW